MTGWKSTTLGATGRWVSGGTPSKGEAEYWGGDIPWISAKSLNDFRVRDSEDRVTESGAKNGTRLLPPGALLFLVRGMSLKTEFRMGITQRAVTFNQDVKGLMPGEGVLPAFLAYAVKARTDEVLDMVEEAGHGTGVLPTHRLQGLELLLPPLDEQRAIAEVLGALDDKIELNRQMNHTLEEMASALFKSWFVDFDPVVAKAEGRKPFGMDAATAALFPSSFDDAMPRGWTGGAVGDLVELQRGFDLPEPLRSPGKVPVMAAGGFHGYHNKAMVEAPGIVTGRSGKIGDVYWVDSPYWPLNTTLWVKRLLNGAGPAFAYHLLRTLDLAALNVGSAVPSLNRNDVHPLSAVVPSRAVLSRFEETVRDWFALRQQNQAESRTLATLRDALLPKLLSGEVRLKQAEKAVEAAL